MKRIKSTVKKILKLDPASGVSPLNNMMYIGSRKHGYRIPQHFFNSDSVCYCVGAGLDISFDTELAVLFGCRVFTIDPMPYSKNYFLDLKQAVSRNEKPVVDEGEFAFEYRINSLQFDRITFVETGLWNETMMAKFYEPKLHNYAGHSIINLQETENYVEASVERLSSLMKRLGHLSVDLLKLEIEGSEYMVIDTIAQDRPDIKIICIEFDEYFHPKGISTLRKIKSYSDKLVRCGYKIAHSSPTFKRTFIRQDIFAGLKANES